MAAASAHKTDYNDFVLLKEFFRWHHRRRRQCFKMFGEILNPPDEPHLQLNISLSNVNGALVVSFLMDSRSMGSNPVPYTGKAFDKAKN